MNQKATVKMARTEVYVPLAMMHQNGVPINSLMDMGCADGTFSLYALEYLVGRHLAVFNIDAQKVYGPSLRKIQEKVGGHYKNCCISSFNGQIKFQKASHPYWATISDGDGDYEWVECRTIDSLLAENPLPPPHFIKMDIEGAEFSALQGAVKTLENTAGIVLETAVGLNPNHSGNFLDSYAFLSARNFSLFDIVALDYRHDQILYHCYAAFLNNRYEFRDKAPAIVANAGDAERLMMSMEVRRQHLLAENERLLAGF